jgi:hypothetical protein
MTLMDLLRSSQKDLIDPRFKLRALRAVLVNVLRLLERGERG